MKTIKKKRGINWSASTLHATVYDLTNDIYTLLIFTQNNIISVRSVVHNYRSVAYCYFNFNRKLIETGLLLSGPVYNKSPVSPLNSMWYCGN